MFIYVYFNFIVTWLLRHVKSFTKQRFINVVEWSTCPRLLRYYTVTRVSFEPATLWMHDKNLTSTPPPPKWMTAKLHQTASELCNEAQSKWKIYFTTSKSITIQVCVNRSLAHWCRLSRKRCLQGMPCTPLLVSGNSVKCYISDKFIDCKPSDRTFGNLIKAN